jgi:hypothetical protein
VAYAGVLTGPKRYQLSRKPLAPAFIARYSQVVGQSGHAAHVTAPAVCFGNNFPACQAWIGTLHLRQVVAYEPASRFWQFQWYETAIFLAVAVALAGFCAWRIRAR